MNKPEGQLTDHAVETFIGNLLRIGVIIAASTVFLGGVIYLIRHGFSETHYRVFQRVPYDLCSVTGILKSAFSFHGRGFIQLGLLLLIATPISRVLFSVIAFARQRDTVYVIVSSIVFSVLLYSLLGR